MDAILRNPTFPKQVQGDSDRHNGHEHGLLSLNHASLDSLGHSHPAEVHIHSGLAACKACSTYRCVHCCIIPISLLPSLHVPPPRPLLLLQTFSIDESTCLHTSIHTGIPVGTPVCRIAGYHPLRALLLSHFHPAHTFPIKALRQSPKPDRRAFRGPRPRAPLIRFQFLHKLAPVPWPVCPADDAAS